MAQRLFGDADPLGQSLTIASTRSRIWRPKTSRSPAWPAPVPHTSSIQFNMLLPFENTEFLFGDYFFKIARQVPECDNRLVQRHTSSSRPTQTRLT